MSISQDPNAAGPYRTPALGDPPPAASKWIDLLMTAINKVGLPLLVMCALGWWSWTQQQQNRADMAALRAENKSYMERCIARTDEKAAAIKESVKEVKTEVQATKAAVQAQTPPPQ